MRSVFFPQLVNGPFGDPALYVHCAHRGEALLFDLGDLHPLSPREILKLRAVFVSHGHIDHLAGFDALLRTLLYRPTELLLCGPPGFASAIGTRLAGYTWNLIESYPFVLTVREAQTGVTVRFRAGNAFRPEAITAEPEPGDVLLETPAYRVRAVPLDHGGIISLAFVLEEPLHVAIHKDALERDGLATGPWLGAFKDLLRAGAPRDTPVCAPKDDGSSTTCPLETLAARIAHCERGMKIAYVTDASPTPKNLERIAELAADAHLLAIEAVFADKDRDRAAQRNHLTARLAGELARRAGAARLLVFHHSPRYLKTPELLAEEARQAFQDTTTIR